jgi:simple sugar transport system substrate-binding protein/basic membrane protein A
MRSRLSLLFVVLIIAGLALAACVQAPASAPAAGKGGFAIVLTGPWQDHSWNEAGYLGAQALGKKGVRIAFSENVKDADAARVLRQYCDQGFEMIVAHSFSYQDAAFQVGTECPKANFAWAGGINKMAKNVADYDQPFYEAAYPIGVLAGSLSKTGKLGALYGFDIPVCHGMGEALLAGAKTVNPKAQLITTAVGDWVDVAKAKQAALAQADAGVDYWIECGEGPALGAIEAAKERGGYVTGYVGDMSSVGPNNVVVSLVWNLEPMFQKMLDETKAGKFNAPYYRYGIAEDALQLKFNDKLKDKVPADVMKKVEQTMADIKAGKVKVEFVPK